MLVDAVNATYDFDCVLIGGAVDLTLTAPVRRQQRTDRTGH